MAWLPLTSTTVAPARLDIARWASAGIILSSVVTRYQLGLVLHAGSLIAPLMAPMPHGTWDSHKRGFFRVHVGCERSGKLRLVEEPKAVLRRQYRRYGRAGWRVLYKRSH